MRSFTRPLRFPAVPITRPAAASPRAAAATCSRASSIALMRRMFPGRRGSPLAPAPAREHGPSRSPLEPAVGALAAATLDRPARRARRGHERLRAEPRDDAAERRGPPRGDDRLAIAALPAGDHRPRLAAGAALAVRQPLEAAGPVRERGARDAH